MINPAIFRGSDIRGKADQDLTPKVAHLIGRAFGTYVIEAGQRLVIVAHDNRPSSSALGEAFMTGVTDTGCHVIDLGLVPTPVLYYAAVQNNHAFASMITASHLPATSNGFKFCQGSKAFYGSALDKVRQRVMNEKFAMGKGTREQLTTISDDYVQMIARKVHFSKTGLKIVVDAQNGATSALAPALLEQLGFQIKRLHCDLDQPYPFERPDPQDVANLKPLQVLVESQGAAVGIAYDGDGDRMGVVDERGHYVPADQIVALFARAVLVERPGAKVIVDVLTSQVVADEVRKHQGVPIIWKSGHSFIKDKLHQEEALLAGESSGHIFFADRYFGYDDGIYASCRLLEILTTSNETLSALMQTLPRLVTSPEERPPCPDTLKFEIVEEAKAAFEHLGYSLNTVDGVRLQFPAGWGLLRASNTEPVFDLRFEAATEQELTDYRRIVWDQIDEIGRRHDLYFNRG